MTGIVGRLAVAVGSLCSIGVIALRGGGDDPKVPVAPLAMEAAVTPSPTPKPDTAETLKAAWIKGNELCRGSYDQREARQGCVAREKADRALKKLGWCFEYSDWRVVPVDYDWHPCSQARPANFVPEPKPAPPPPIATAIAYDALKYGMTLDQVEQILGFRGNEKAASYIAGYETKMVMWQNPDGGNVTVEFQNGRLLMKAQYGLR